MDFRIHPLGGRVDYLRAQVLSACQQPGASVASVARAHSLNANLGHKW